MKYTPVYLFSLVVLLASGCNPYDDIKVSGIDRSVGYVPAAVVSEVGLKAIKLTSPLAVERSGKLLIAGRFLFIGEIKKGIHVFDNINPKSPKPLAFVAVPAITDFIFQNNALIVNNGNDLVSLNALAFTDIATRGTLPESASANSALFGETKRLERVFVYPNYPEQRNTFFECADTLGYVTEWKIDSSLKKTNCYR